MVFRLPPFFLLLLCALAALCPSSVEAATTRTSLFLVQNIRSDLRLAYTFQRNGYGQSQSDQVIQRHRSEGSYGFSLDYSIYGRNIWSGTLSGRLGIRQFLEKETGVKDYRWDESREEYRFRGQIAKRSRTPITFDSFSTTDVRERRFSGDYITDTRRNSISVRLRSRILPASVQLFENDTSTSGLEQDRSTQTTSLSVSGGHSWRRFSRTLYSVSATDAVVDFDDTSGVDQHTETVHYRLFNELRPWFADEWLELDSEYSLKDEAGFRQGREWRWQETLHWTPGPALRGMLLYGKDFQRRYDIETHQDLVRGRLTHQLFSSLTTTLNGQFRQKEFGGGEDRLRGYGLQLAYSKKLARGRVLHIGVEESRSLIDRDISGIVPVVDELIVVPDDSSIDPMLLSRRNVLIDTVEIRSEDGSETYALGADYTLDVFLVDQLRIIIPESGSAINEDDTLRVSYQYEVAPTSRFEEATHGLNASLFFFRKLLSVYTRVRLSDQTSRRSVDSDPTLSDTGYYSLGFKGQLDPYSFGIEAEYTDRSAAALSSYSKGVKSYLLYNTQKRGRRFYSHFHQVYLLYGTDRGENRYEREVQRLSNRSGYHNKLTEKILYKLEGEYRYSFGDNPDRHETYAMIGMDYRHRQIRFSIELSDEWDIYQGTETHDNCLEIQFTRSF
ncbi:MAG: hypothetical protein C0618_11050 [Desulfuromonas sp.]|nr:MAG: hypothetical protein C0618_11050 [Desulfuromonas sp.]